MKNIFAISTIFLSLFSNAQVIIGDNKGTASNKNSVLLEFAENSSTEKNNKGLILPYVSSLPSLPAGGTILLHTSNNGTESRMKYYNGNQWVDLSTRDADVSKDLEIQKGKVEDASSMVVISDKAIDPQNPVVKGALVLESSSKAMVLPIVEDVNNIPNPSPGMIVYVKKENAKRLAVYNGKYWSFWRP